MNSRFCALLQSSIWFVSIITETNCDCYLNHDASIQWKQIKSVRLVHGFALTALYIKYSYLHMINSQNLYSIR